METIEFLVVDGDASIDFEAEEVDKDRAPHPTLVHEVLKKLGFNHFIYPSWSNGQEIAGAGATKVKS